LTCSDTFAVEMYLLATIHFDAVRRRYSYIPARSLCSCNINLLSVPWVCTTFAPEASVSMPLSLELTPIWHLCLFVITHHTYSVVFLKLTVSSMPSVPASGWQKCLADSAFSWHCALWRILLTYLLTTYFNPPLHPLPFLYHSPSFLIIPFPQFLSLTRGLGQSL